MQFKEIVYIILDGLYGLYLCHHMHFLASDVELWSFYFQQALGTGFSQFAEPVFRRCINIIQTQQFAKVMVTLTDLIFYNLVYIISS